MGRAGGRIPDATPGSRPRKTDMRSAMNAILYLLRTACPWRYLPRDGCPPRSTVYSISRKFQVDGTWHSIWDHLRPMLREHESREGSSSAGIIDDQTIASAERGGSEADTSTADKYKLVDNVARQHINCREIHSPVDTLGLPLRLVIPSAGLQDRDGAALLFEKTKPRFPWLECVFADTGFNDQQTHGTAGGCGWRSPAAILMPSASTSSRDVGLWNGPLPGSAETDARPRISRTSPRPCWRSCHSPPSSSASVPHRSPRPAMHETQR